MHGHDALQVRDARLMNGVALLGGRSPSALEVEIAFGIVPKPAQSSRLLTWLRELVAMANRSPVAPARKPAEPGRTRAGRTVRTTRFVGT